MHIQAPCAIDTESREQPPHLRMSFSPDFRQHIEGDLELRAQIGVLLPTYCETANLEKLVTEIENLNLPLSILILDDSSPDGTADVARSLQKKYRNILLLTRPKKSGLGTAITDGFKVFLSLEFPPKHIITMDADYSHNPKDVPKLIEASREEFGLVVGSRYCQDGGTQDWSIMRLAISKIANLLTKLAINAEISDYTSGMRCYSTNLVRKMIPDLHSHTYEIQIETIRQANLRRSKMKEIPITFVNRKKGRSKLSINEIKDFVSYILSIHRRQNQCSQPLL
jgi:dolichol-phosphate mannosyltransferase